VFGGQVDGKIFNDLWAFDLNTRQGGTWSNLPKASRFLHSVLVTFPSLMAKILYLIFGGADGRYYYNDSWVFDTTTRLWSELKCIGYIPTHREGHGAAIVDDVVYVLGGRDVNGHDLGDLRALEISNERWYTFQKMGCSIPQTSSMCWTLGTSSTAPMKPAHRRLHPTLPRVESLLLLSSPIFRRYDFGK